MSDRKFSTTIKYFPHLAAAVVLGGGLVVGGEELGSFIRKWESSGKLITTVYADKLAGGLPTVCDGLTRHVTTTPIVVGEVWSEAKCNAEMDKALIKVQTQLVMCMKLPPSDSILFSFTSHAWNNGAPATCGSQAMKAFNVGDAALACQRLSKSDSGKPVWSYVKTGRIVNGKPEMKFVPGLGYRRDDETGVCGNFLYAGKTEPQSDPARIERGTAAPKPAPTAGDSSPAAGEPAGVAHSPAVPADAERGSVWARLVRWWQGLTGSAQGSQAAAQAADRFAGRAGRGLEGAAQGADGAGA